MNDFTKEELENILSWADVYTEFGQSWVYQNQKELIDKVQAMIDNYCEHDMRYASGEFSQCENCGHRE